MSEPAVLAGAEEFSLPGGPAGALLIHGFTSTPQAMRGLGDFLAARGLAIEGIRLPGHGTTWQDLDARRPDEWRAAVEAGFDKVAAGREHVFLVALSFGTALAIDLAARRPQEIAGLVALAPFLQTKDPRRFLSGVIRRVAASLPGVANDIADPDGRELAYDRLPTTAAYHMLRFGRGARALLPQVDCPLLVIHSHNDHTALPFNAESVYSLAASSDKELVWVDDSYHVITLDRDRDEVFRRTYEFISARARL